MSITRIHDKNVTLDAKAVAAERRNPSRPSISRRAVLRGTAAFIALPALESLLTPSQARAQAAARPIRFMCWHIPCGVWGPSWFPIDTGANYTLSPTLTSLAPVKSKVLVLAGVQNTPAVSPTGSHGCGPPGMTTCVQGTKPAIQMGISVDQVYAQALGKATRIPSMQISGTDSTFADVDYPAVYNGTTAWASATQPLPPVANAGVIFDQLFAGVSAVMPGGDPAAAAALAKRKALRLSVLDEIKNEHTSLVARLGATDRRKLEEYLTSVRAAETSIQQSSIMPTNVPACTPGTLTRPTLANGPLTNGNGKQIPDPVTYTALVIDLMVLAFRCDATRVINYQQMNGGHSSYSTFPWLKINQDHHAMSHHNFDPVTGALLAQIDAWEIGQFSSFLQKLDAVNEGTGTLLDNSLIFLSSEISDGNRHNQGTTSYPGFTGPTGKPILLAGTAGGKIKSGRHILYANEPQANLLIALLNTMGVPATTFGAVGNAPTAGLT
jgi:Protein of unknown function (DUF1552)